jgi:hypothetical protein
MAETSVSGMNWLWTKPLSALNARSSKSGCGASSSGAPALAAVGKAANRAGPRLRKGCLSAYVVRATEKYAKEHPPNPMDLADAV